MRSLIALGCAAALAGCLENPGPDGDLNRRYRFAEVHGTASGITVTVELAREGGRVHATPATEDQDAAGMDSIEFFIHQAGYSYGFMRFLEDGQGRFNFLGVDRKPGTRGASIGDVPDRLPEKTVAEDYRLWVLRMWDNGRPVGHPLAGKYNGTWERLDPVEGLVRGEVTLLLSNDGILEAGMSTGGDPERTWGMMAGVSPDSVVTVIRQISSGSGSGSPGRFPEAAKAKAFGDSLILETGFKDRKPEYAQVIRCARAGVR